MSNSRITVLAIGAALVLAFGAGIGSAAGNGASSGSANPTVKRDHGRGHWYERACDAARPGVASCEAQVVAAADGTPLATGTPPAAAFGPAQFHSAYNLPTTAPNAQTVAIIDAFDDPNIESDLANYSSYYGLPPCTTANGCFKKVNQTGGTLAPIKDPGWSLEIALDVETAHAICQNCKILLVEATSATTANLYAAENEAVKLGATAISNSWLTSEYSGETVDDVNFNHPGVAITASSGDNGYGVGYPAASRYVTAVGGTTLALGSGGSYGGESAWSGSGSGCSAYEPKPAWQTDTGCSRRSVADVSADADPNTGAAVYDTVSYFGQTGWFQVGGTSLSSPLVASVYALTGSYGGPSAPYGNAGFLHDVTTRLQRQLLAGVPLHRGRRLRRADRPRLAERHWRLLRRLSPGTRLLAERVAGVSDGDGGRRDDVFGLRRSERRLRGLGRPERERPAGRRDGELQSGVDHHDLDADDHDVGGGRPGRLRVHDHRYERAPDSFDHGEPRRPGRVSDR